MILNPPFSITSGLYPGIKIGNATLECREGLQFVIVFDDMSEYKIEDYKPGACHNLQQCFEDILAFLSTWIEALDYPESDNKDLFPKNNLLLVKWAKKNSDDISMLQFDIQETEGLIIE